MKRAIVVSQWTGTGTEDDPNRPVVGDTYNLFWSDVTAQSVEQIRPDPNAFSIEIVCEDAVLSQMDADGVPIIWAEGA